MGAGRGFPSLVPFFSAPSLALWDVGYHQLQAAELGDALLPPPVSTASQTSTPLHVWLLMLQGRSPGFILLDSSSYPQPYNKKFPIIYFDLQAHAEEAVLGYLQPRGGSRGKSQEG